MTVEDLDRYRSLIRGLLHYHDRVKEADAMYKQKFCEGCHTVVDDYRDALAECERLLDREYETRIALTDTVL